MSTLCPPWADTALERTRPKLIGKPRIVFIAVPTWFSTSRSHASIHNISVLFHNLTARHRNFFLFHFNLLKFTSIYLNSRLRTADIPVRSNVRQTSALDYSNASTTRVGRARHSVRA